MQARPYAKVVDIINKIDKFDLKSHPLGKHYLSILHTAKIQDTHWVPETLGHITRMHTTRPDVYMSLPKFILGFSKLERCAKVIHIDHNGVFNYDDIKESIYDVKAFNELLMHIAIKIVKKGCPWYIVILNFKNENVPFPYATILLFEKAQNGKPTISMIHYDSTRKMYRVTCNAPKTNV